MSNYGYYSIPRSLRHDPIWCGFTSRERHVYETLLDFAAFKEYQMNDHGVIITVNKGQFLTTSREFAELCNQYRPKGDRKYCKAFILRCWSKFNLTRFSNQEVNHKKTLLTITREDILNISEPRSEPKVNQDRTKTEPQTKNDKKDDNDKKFKKSEKASDCSQDELAKQSPSPLIQIEDFSLFDIDSYRLPDGKSLSNRLKNALRKCQDEYYELFIRNLLHCQEKWESGKLPRHGNYEQMLGDSIAKDYAGQKNLQERNRIYASLMAKEHPDLKIKVMKTVMKLDGESISFDLPSCTIENIIEGSLKVLVSRR